MGWKAIIFKFKDPLSEEQEKHFILLFQNMRDKIDQGLTVSLGALDNPLARLSGKLGGEATRDYMKNQISIMKENLNDFLKLEKPTDRTYRFMVLADQLRINAPFKSVDYWEELRKKFLKSRNRLASRLKIPEKNIEIMAADLAEE